MAIASLAYAASAGAITLALSTAVWAWRYRQRAEATTADLTQRNEQLRAALHEAETATIAFEGALIAVEGEEARLVWGDDAMMACAEALGLREVDPASLLEGIAATAPDHALKLRSLINQGEPCRFLTPVPGGALVIEGRPSGGMAWLRVTLALDATPGGKFAALADRLPNPAWLADSRGLVSWANRAFIEAAEVSTVDEARAREAAFDRGAQAIVVEAGKAKAQREGFRWVTVRGQRRAYKIFAEPVTADEIAAFAIDITESEENREALVRHTAAHDETLNHLADAVAIFGPSRSLNFYNTAFQQLWDLDAAWLDERPTHGELLDRLRQRRRLPEVTDYSKWKAKELDFYGSTEVSPDDMWSLPDGRTLRVVRQPHPLGGILVLFADITGELKLRAQYNALIQVQRATLDKLNDAVAVFGSDGRMRLHNQAFERLWKISAGQLQDAGGFEGVAGLCKPLVHDQALWSELKARVTDPDPVARIPISGEARTSDRRTFAYQSQPLPDGATLLAFGDVTARQELQSALDQRSAALSETERLKREFVGNVSYELRTPLTTILGYAELLENEQGLSDRAKSHINSVRQAAAQLARSIDDVLDIAQVDAGEMALFLGDVPVKDTLEVAAERVRATIETSGGKLVLDVSNDAGLIRADPRRIGQALDHLLDNATRAISSGGTVTLSARRAAGSVTIQVKDTGRGIPYHQQAHVFDRFVGRDRGGPGLGLALVKTLVELHGGWVALESAPGDGATFTVHLPEAAASAAAAEPELDLRAGAA